MTSKRIVYFDYLRLIATFAVVTLHVTAQCWYTADPRTFEWNIYNLYDGANRWGVPVFVMISGALFLGRKQPLKRILRVHVLKMVIVFAFWSSLYALWGYGVTGSIKNINELIWELIVGRFHLWFLPMIAGLYIIVPFLYKIIEDKKSTLYFLILSFIFSFLIPQCIIILGLVFHEHDGLSQALSKFLSNANIHFMLGYSSYFILGHVIHNTELSKNQVRGIYFTGVLGLLFTIVASAYVSIRQEAPYHFYGNFTVNTLLVAIAVFTFGKTYLNGMLRPCGKTNLLMYLSKCSFGVYLIHLLVLDTFRVFLKLTPQSFNPFLSVPVISLLVYCISFLLSYVLNKVPFVNRWLM